MGARERDYNAICKKMKYYLKFPICAITPFILLYEMKMFSVCVRVRIDVAGIKLRNTSCTCNSKLAKMGNTPNNDNNDVQKCLGVMQ